MHPVIMRQLAADHIREIHAKAEDERLGRHARRARRRSPPVREKVVRLQRAIRAKESTDSPPLSTYSAPGGLRQDPGRAA
jgi:hypothetical protein